MARFLAFHCGFSGAGAAHRVPYKVSVAKGFSFVELVIVLLIVALLAAGGVEHRGRLAPRVSGRNDHGVARGQGETLVDATLGRDRASNQLKQTCDWIV